MKRDAVTQDDPKVPVYVAMQCIVCQEIDFRKEERLLRSGNPKCPFCGGLMRQQGRIR